MEEIKRQCTYYELLLSGLKASLPVGIGYLPIALTFGVIASSQGLPLAVIVAMSAFVYAGASQFVALNVIAAGAGPAGLILTTFFVNLRHLLMTATTSEKFRGESKGWLAFVSYGITDEVFSLIATDSRRRLSRPYALGVISLPYLAWVGGSAAGAVMGGVIPAVLEASMEIALYAMFIGLLVPEVKTSRSKLYVAFLALGLSSIFHWLPLLDLSEGWTITLTTLIAALFGAYFLGEEGAAYESD